ncbi:Muscle M-line assembly protein unc-89-like protein, partial [Leptotrombidium deliense]
LNIDLSVLPNANVTLEVQIEGIPKPDVKWFHNRKEISTGDEYVLSSDSSKATCRLQIPKITSGLLGKYSVIAENIGGKVESSGSVSHVEPPKFSTVLHDLDVLLNDNVALEVEAEGKPKPEVKWFHDVKEITADDDHTLWSDDDFGLHQLHTPRVTPEYGGKYSVVAENEGGKVESKGDGGEYYCVARNKVGQATSQTAYLDMKRDGQQGQPPRFVKVLNDLDVEMDERVTMEVQIEGTLIPDVKWLHNGREIRAGDEYILSADDSK